MTRCGLLLCCLALLFESFAVFAQTTSGTSATIVIPIIAQTGSFGSEVTVYNPNGGAITVNPVFYDAQNTATPGPKTCTSVSLGANVSKVFTLAAQCALPAGSNFGLLVLSETTATNRFYGYARTQTPQGVGFSTEGFPIENFNDQLQHATGLKRVAASGGLPANQTNCFVATLADAVSYELRLYDGTTNVQLGSTLSGSLAAFQQYRYLDVFALAGVAAGDKTNVRAQFTNLTGNKKRLIGFCTVQENTTLSADFRIAKSYGGTPQNAFVQGGNAYGTTALLGTTDNQPLTINVNGQPAMRLVPAAPNFAGTAFGVNPNVIGGQSGNFVTAGTGGATIGGGGGCNAAVGGSCGVASMNRVTGDFGTVGGGFANAAGFFDTASGGDRNSSIGGHSTVGGGQDNVADSNYATVAGGVINHAGGDQGVDSTVGGGIANSATGQAATVPGGAQNVASGSFSVATGQQANALHANSFMWNGWSSGSASTFRSSAFQIHGENGLDVEFGSRRVDGGGTSWVYMGGTGFPGQHIATSTGAWLSTGGQWNNASDRNRKTAVASVDPQQILEKVVALPVTAWQYQDEDAAIRHIGPMAQDFHAAFGLGGPSTSIGTVDADGVALAAIQGLHAIVRDNASEIRRVVDEKAAQIDAQRALIDAQRAQIETQRTQIDALSQRIERLSIVEVEIAVLRAALSDMRRAQQTPISAAR